MEERWRIWEDGSSSKPGGPQPNIRVSVQDPNVSRALNSAIFVPVTSTYLLDYLWNLSKIIPLKALDRWASEFGCKRITGEIVYKADTKFHPQRAPDSVGLGWSLRSELLTSTAGKQRPTLGGILLQIIYGFVRRKRGCVPTWAKGRRKESAPKGQCAGATIWELGASEAAPQLSSSQTF